LTFLLSRPDIDPHRIGLIGHSEGGLIAPMLAAGIDPQTTPNPNIAFLVLLAGPAVPGSVLIPEQTQLVAIASGQTSEAAEKTAAKNAQLIHIVLEADKDSPDPATLDQRLRTQFATILPEPQIDPVVKSFATPWLRFFLAYDPAPALRKITIPVLALDGSKDVQVSAAQNLPALRAALTAAGNTHFEALELPGLNHLFQPATTGGPNEYGQIETTIDPSVLIKLSTWILQQPPLHTTP
ncbi:MAG: alpha/beta hydrolase, partial [Acidobacteriaceae bacterium]